MIDLIIPQQESGAEAWAKLTGEKLAPPKAYYVIDGVEFWTVFIGISYPTVDRPGAVVSVGTRKQIDDPEFVVMDVELRKDILSLFDAAHEVRQRYYIKGGTIGRMFYGEPGRFEELRTEHNKPMFGDRRRKLDIVIVAAPEGGETAESGLKYMSTIMDLARGVSPRLCFKPGCESLQAALTSALEDRGASEAVNTYDPQIMALGFACRALLVQRPWLVKIPKYEPPKDRNDWMKGKAWWQRVRRKQNSRYGFVTHNEMMGKI